jgi:hypothetical protein
MALTQAQSQQLKADITADPTLSAFPNNSDGNFSVAAAYNLPANPAWYVWRTQVPTKDAKKATTWTEFIGRSQGERDAWQFMLSNGIIDASDPNVRQGILDIFSGPSGANTRAALTEMAKILATRVQKLFSTGTGSQAAPATMAANISEFYQISYQEVEAARNLP